MLLYQQNNNSKVSIKSWRKVEAASECSLIDCDVTKLTMKMEALFSSETLVTTWHLHRLKSLKYHICHSPLSLIKHPKIIKLDHTARSTRSLATTFDVGSPHTSLGLNPTKTHLTTHSCVLVKLPFRVPPPHPSSVTYSILPPASLSNMKAEDTKAYVTHCVTSTYGSTYFKQ